MVPPRRGSGERAALAGGAAEASSRGAPEPTGVHEGEDPDGAELVRRVQDREPGAMEALLEEYRPLMLHGVGQFVTGEAAKEDLLQDVLGYVVERLDRDRFDPEKGTLSAWLYRVVWCRCVDLKRRESTGGRLPTLPSFEDLTEPSDDSPDPSEVAGEYEVGSLVRDALAELDPDDAELLRLRHMRDLTIVEIAARRSQSLETVKYRLKRATQALRGRLVARRVAPEAAS